MKSVDDYYRAQGIAACAFRCPSLADCSHGAQDFVEVREPMIGDLYEQHILPRLLFVSLDPATDMVGRSAEARSSAAVFEWETRQARPVSGGPEFKKQAHWYRTYEFAHRLLAPIARERGMGVLSFSSMYRYFAHTNSAKCKDMGVGTAQAHARIFANCSRYIAGEVIALEPDILVTQGKYAREACADLPVLMQGVAPNAAYSADVLDLPSGPAVRFQTNHPNRKDNSYRNEVAEAWRWYSRVSSTFASEGVDGLVRNLGFKA